MRNIKLSLAVLVATAFSAPHAMAFNLPFQDNFDGISSSTLNAAPAGWSVFNGSVDQIAAIQSSFWKINCVGNTGGCIDLDGSYPRGTSQAGVMVTSDSVVLTAGQQYQLSAMISGNQRISWLGPDTVQFGFVLPANASAGNPPPALASTTTSPISWDSPFTLYTMLYTPSVTQAVSIYFLNLAGNDFVGPVIDNVSLVAVPLPASAWLLLSGLVVLAVMARRRSQFGDAGMTAV
jgi:hypothetical protein